MKIVFLPGKFFFPVNKNKLTFKVKENNPELRRTRSCFANTVTEEEFEPGGFSSQFEAGKDITSMIRGYSCGYFCIQSGKDMVFLNANEVDSFSPSNEPVALVNDEMEKLRRELEEAKLQNEKLSKQIETLEKERNDALLHFNSIFSNLENATKCETLKDMCQLMEDFLHEFDQGFCREYTKLGKRM